MPHKFCLGRKARKFNPRVPHLSALMGSKHRRLMPIPVDRDYTAGMPDDLGEMLNDQLGDCVAEGVVVAAGETDRAYRGSYDGPLTILTTASGKKLPVTPNHAVLTERGFKRVRHLQKGDNLISTSRADIFPGAPALRGETNLNDSPTAIEKVFATLVANRGAIREVMPRAVNFHGDEQFFNGNIDVVGADRFLRRDAYAALHQPQTEYQISAARKLQRHLASKSATFLAGLRGFASALGDVGLSGQRPALRYAHAGIPQTNGLSKRAQFMPGAHDRQFKPAAVNPGFTHQRLNSLAGNIAFDQRSKVTIPEPCAGFVGFTARPDLRASRHQPSAQGHPTDAGLPGKLADAFPGLITQDSVVDVDCQRFQGHVYDLSTRSRWYSANGILVHNCTSAAKYHSRQVRTFVATGTMITESDACVEQFYEESCGYVPGDPSTDQGGNMQDVLTYEVTKGLPIGDGTQRLKIAAFVEIDPRNPDDLMLAIDECGLIDIGFNVPAFLMPDDAAPPLVWDVQATNRSIIGGHDVIQPGRVGGIYTTVSWGSPNYRMTEAFFEEYVDEAYGIITEEWITSTGKTPFGLGLSDWQALMEALK